MVHLRQLYMPVLTKGVLGGLWTALQMRSQGEASPPVVLTRAAGLVLRRGGMLLTGTILVETLFLIPGMGRLLVEAVFHRDAPVIGTIAAIIVGIALLSRFLGNLLLAALEESPPAKTETTKGAESVRALAIGGGVTVGLLFLLLLMPLLTSQDHRAIGTNVKFASPSADSWLGTDQLGRDAFSRVLHGGRNAALISLPMGLLALFVGFAMVVTRVMVARARIPELVYGIEGVLEGLVAVPWLVVGVLIQVVMGPDWPFLALAAILVPRALRVGWALGAGERPEVMHLAPIALRLVARSS